MSPRRAWADKMTRLELERLQVSTAPEIAPLEPITAEQAAENRQILLDAFSKDPGVLAQREREAWLDWGHESPSSPSWRLLSTRNEEICG